MATTRRRCKAYMPARKNKCGNPLPEGHEHFCEEHEGLEKGFRKMMKGKVKRKKKRNPAKKKATRKKATRKKATKKRATKTPAQRKKSWRCAGKTADGTRCKRRVCGRSKYCPAHKGGKIGKPIAKKKAKKKVAKRKTKKKVTRKKATRRKTSKKRRKAANPFMDIKVTTDTDGQTYNMPPARVWK